MVRNFRKPTQYKDVLATKRRSRLVRILLIAAGVLVILFIAGIYAVLYSGLFTITKIDASGTGDMADKVQKLVEEQTKDKFLFLPVGKNILLFKTSATAANILGTIPELKSLDIAKKDWHTLIVSATSRKAVGIWCFYRPDEQCHYFDDSNFLWGQAAKSSGSLILTILDHRDGNGENIDQDIVTAALQIFSDRDLFSVQQFIIPANSVDELDAQTSEGYLIKFSRETDINTELKNLKIFLDSKAPGFTAQYIDLRVSGRVYYK